MNKKNALDSVLALALTLLVLYGGTFFVWLISSSTWVSLDLLVDVSDFTEMAGPVIGGYFIGRRLGRYGLLAGLCLGVLAAAIFNIGIPNWSYHEFWLGVFTAAVTQFVIPAALAGGCGELHSLRTSRGTAP